MGFDYIVLRGCRRFEWDLVTVGLGFEWGFDWGLIGIWLRFDYSLIRV